MKNFFRKIQLLSNIAIIVIAILLSVITVKLFFPATLPVSTTGVPKANSTSDRGSTLAEISAKTSTPLGKTFPLDNIDWKSNQKTLVLYISTTCRYCNESSPFYKRLVDKYSNDKSVKILAVLPQTVDESKTHLNSLGVGIVDVYSARLSSIGVSATPTILLVNDSGIVLEYWRGKLTNEKETEVLNRLAS